MSHSSLPFDDPSSHAGAIASLLSQRRQHRDPKGLWWALAGISIVAHGGVAIAAYDWFIGLKPQPAPDQPIPIEWIERPASAPTPETAAEPTPNGRSNSEAKPLNLPTSTTSVPDTATPNTSTPAPAAAAPDSGIQLTPSQPQTAPDPNIDSQESEDPRGLPNRDLAPAEPSPDPSSEEESSSTPSTDTVITADGTNTGDGLPQIQDGAAPRLPSNEPTLGDNSGIRPDSIDPSNVRSIPAEIQPTEFRVTLDIEPLPLGEDAENTEAQARRFEPIQLTSAAVQAPSQRKNVRPSVHDASERPLVRQNKQAQAPEMPDAERLPSASEAEPQPSAPPEPASADPAPEMLDSPEPTPTQPNPTPLPEPVVPQPNVPQPETEPTPRLPSPITDEQFFEADPTQSECEAVSDVDTDLGQTASFTVVVDEIGQVSSAEPMVSETSEYQAFAQCLLQQWEFEPATHEGEPVVSDAFLAHVTITVAPDAPEEELGQR